MPMFLPLQPVDTPDPYGDWHPESRLYAEYGSQILNEIAFLEGHVGGPLTTARLQMLCAMCGGSVPDGGFIYEAAAIRKLKAAPGRGCPPHIRDRLSIQLAQIWPRDIPRPPKSKQEAA